MKVIIASNKVWHEDVPSRLNDKLVGHEFILITSPQDLTIENLRVINPQYVFFSHWSYLIPEEVFTTFECIIFHMTDLPYGRGGSPLQNLIKNGINETMVSALRCEKSLDAGPIYLKQPLSLHGNAEEIYLRATDIMVEMMVEIMVTQPNPVAQTGNAVYFKRRTPAESSVAGIKTLAELYDHIRMLDADGYPKAFMEVGNFRFEFQRAALLHNRMVCDVVIWETEDE